MKKLLLGILILFSLSVSSQTVTSWINIKDYFKLGSNTISGIAEDSALIDVSKVKLPTEWAVYWFVKNHVNASGKTTYFKPGLSDTSAIPSPVIGDVVFIYNTGGWYRYTGYWLLQTTIPISVSGTANETEVNTTTGVVVVGLPDEVTIATSLKVPNANIDKITNLSNGFIKASAGDGTLIVDNSTYALSSALGSYLPLTGGTLIGNLLWTDNTYDIGASGATRPRSLYLGTSLKVPSADITKLSNLPTNGFVKTNSSDGTLSIDNSTYALSGALGSYLPLAGGTMLGHILSTDNTYDIGGTSNHFRSGYFGTSLSSPYAYFSTATFCPILYGNSTSGGDLVLMSTSHATKGTIQIGSSVYDEVNNRLGIRITPTAALHLPAGATGAGRAPLKFTSGPLVTSIEAGAVEYDGVDYWFSNNALSRYKMPTINDLNNYLPLAGGTMLGGILFTDNTYDIGASGATRPRSLYLGTSLITPSASITKLSNLPTNGFVKTSSSDGTLIVDNSTYALSSALSSYLALAGGTMAGSILFTDNTYDIGASGATRPRSLYLGTSLKVPSADITKISNLSNGFIKASAGDGTLIVDNSTYALSSALSSYLALAGGTMVGHILSTDNTYDIGGTSNRFRTGYFGTSIFCGTHYGSNSSGGSLTLMSTSHATKGTILLGSSTYDEVNNRLGIRVTPTAALHLPAGATSANNAPLKFTSGSLTTTPEAGAVEYDGTDYWLTNGALSRNKIPIGAGVTGSGTANQMSYWSSSSAITGSSNWTYDGTRTSRIKSYTTTSNGDYGDLSYGTVTARATANDSINFETWRPRFIASANNQTFAVLDIQPRTTVGAFTATKTYGVKVTSSLDGPSGSFGQASQSCLIGVQSSQAGLWNSVFAPTNVNQFVFQDGAGETYLNSAGSSNRLNFQIGGSTKAYISSTGLSIGTFTSNGILTLKAGGNAGNAIPIHFTSGALQTSSVPGAAIEYNTMPYACNDKLNRFPLGGLIYQAYTDANNGTTVETDLYTYTTKAATLNTDGENLKSHYIVNLTNTSATATLKVYFAGTSIANTGALTVNSTGAVNVDVLIVRTASTTARAFVRIEAPNTSTALYTNETDLTGLTLSGTNIVKITGQSSVGSSDIVGKMAMLYWSGPAAN